MELLSTIAFYIGVVSYSAAATLFFVDLARPDAGRASSRWAPHALGAGAIAHSVHLASALVVGGLWRVGAMPFALSLCALVVVSAYLALRVRMRIDAIGVVVSPIALTFLVAAQFVGRGEAPTGFPRTLLALHIFANFFGVALFLLAGAAGAFYLFQERRLKAKRVSPLQGKLPALDALDSTEHRLLLAGFPLLTFGIVTGAMFAGRMDAWTSAGVARATLAYATWLLVAAVLVLRSVAGWRGRRAAYGTLAGVACVMLVIVIYAAHSSSGATL